MLGEEQIRTVCTVLLFDYLFLNVYIPEQDIDSFFFDSPLVFLSEWSYHRYSDSRKNYQSERRSLIV
jgi:hypothetical protein